MENEKKGAIIGMGFRYPGESNSSSKLWNNLINKFDGIVDATTDEYPRWNKNHLNADESKTNHAGLIDIKHWKEFDSLFFGINPNEVEMIDPQQRLSLKCTFEAFEDAMMDPIKLRGSDTSVFIGCSTLDYKDQFFNKWDTVPNNSFLHSLANRISYCFDLRGESITLDTACSSTDYSIVGGVNFISSSDFLRTGLYLNVLSKQGKCKVFNSDADGFVRAEGCGIFILKRLSTAIKDGDNIYCIVDSTNSNEDGSFNKSNFFRPSKESQSYNIKMALNKSKLNSNYISYIEAHGTGTPVGDPIEAEAISYALCDADSTRSLPLLIGSVKSNVGHLEAASGAISLSKICLMFKNRQFAPNINFDSPNDKIKFKEWNLKVVDTLIPISDWNFNSNKPIIMAMNNFGITGSNTCIILSEYINNQNYNIFSGQGSQYINMALKLYECNNFFKNEMISIDKSLSLHFGYSVFDKFKLINQENQSLLHFPIIVQPILFMIQVSLFRLFKNKWGINPSDIVGHSFGEMPAAYCSGMISFEIACLLVYKRSLYQNETNGMGKMLSINIFSIDFIENYSNKYPYIEISCINSQESIVIGGNEIELIEISNSLKEKVIGCLNLHNLCIEMNWKLKQFILPSTQGTVLGAPRQCNYLCANNVLDLFSKYRNSIGLNSTTINYGSIGQSGEVSKNSSILKFLIGNGFNPISTNIFLGSIDLVIQNNKSISILMINDFNDSIKSCSYPFINKIDFITNRIKCDDHNNLSNIGSNNLNDTISLKMSDLLSIPIEKLNNNIKLVDLGVDSLILVQLKNWIDKEYFINLFNTSQLQKMTISN